MMHTVLMPFSRPQFIPTLMEHMQGQGVTWVPLVSDEKLMKAFPSKDWIKPWHCELPSGVNPGNWLIDRFFDWHLQRGATPGDAASFYRNDHFVSFMTDDCLWNYNYYRKLQRHFITRNKGGNEIRTAVIISASLGPGGAWIPPHYDPDDFARNNCRTFATRFEHLTCRADLLKDVRFGHAWCADGLVIERLVEEHYGGGNGGVRMAKDAVVYFNALQPEMWGFPPTHQR